MIVGVARSGTTLVQRLASELDGVWVPPETQFWRHGPRLAGGYRWPLSAEEVDRLLDDCRSLPGLADYEVDYDVVRTRLPEHPWLWDVFDALTTANAPTATSLIGEKTPAHVRWTTRLLSDVNGLRVIGVIRDPFATFASHKHVAWGVKDPIEFAVRWRLATAELREAASLFPDRTLLLDYDEVATAPDRTRAEIADLLGVQPTVRTEELGEVGTLFDDGETWKHDALGSIAPSGRGRAELSGQEIRLIEAITTGRSTGASGDDASVAAAVATERRAAASTALPLPLSAAHESAWSTSDAARLQAWRAKAEVLRDERALAVDRFESWKARAEELQASQEAMKAQIDTLQADLERANTRVARQQTQLDALRNRRSLRYADRLGRLLRKHPRG